ncbi:ComEA family DNA-binding protein [Chitinophaga ginsengisoli]|uniref:Competence ComEA-like helix-hairpin-helix protein n=1 Tax=Chitinophaga ginsengisoli TaxID=363837 RepID=A0A2P8GQ33_9BACT|nr:helix-hairpin-helix domain-containing protein [Chitinophaga ginsengisoli]PSL36072.1 competence ComEA-like helix-hairpin-helix protein [Chitinophaga ginsengisoli]
MKQALWKAYNSFSRKERQGILFLLILTGSCVAMPSLWERCVLLPAEVSATDSVLSAEVAAFHNALLNGTKVFPVDARSRTNFRRRDTQHTWRERNNTWQAPGVRQEGDRRKAYQKSIPVLDINTADSALWESLPGIGPVLAARIVKFREKLGGFYSISQVGETYGLADSTFNKIQASLRLHKVSLKKIDLNQMDEKSLAQHPYIRYKLARLIVLYRNNHGPFRQVEDLLGIPLVDDSIYRKIEHYIKTENSPL